VPISGKAFLAELELAERSNAVFGSAIQRAAGSRSAVVAPLPRALLLATAFGPSVWACGVVVRAAGLPDERSCQRAEGRSGAHKISQEFLKTRNSLLLPKLN